MKLLVVGGSGFIGRNLLQATRGKHEAVATYNTSESFPSFLTEQGLDAVTAVRCDLRSEGAAVELTSRFGDFDKCVFLASDTRVANLSTEVPADVTNNILPIANFVKHYRGGPIVYMSSGAVYTGIRGRVSPKTNLQPEIPYSISKLADEHYIRYHSTLNAAGNTIIRFFGAYGRYEAERKITRKLLLQILRTKDAEIAFTTYGNGENLIDVMHIDDAVRALVRVIEGKPTGQVFDLCGGSPLTINQFVRRVCAIFGKTARLGHEGIAREYILARASNKEFTKKFGFTPKTKLREGMTEYALWLKKAVAI